jgi:hypothetical protein
MVFLLPFFMVFSHPLIYFVVPRLLSRAKYIQFLMVILCWGIAGWYFNAFYRATVLAFAECSSPANTTRISTKDLNLQNAF